MSSKYDVLNYEGLQLFYQKLMLLMGTDETLTQENKPADASIVGKIIEELSADLGDLLTNLNSLRQQNLQLKSDLENLNKKLNNSLTEEDIEKLIEQKTSNVSIERIETSGGTLSEEGLKVSPKDSNIDMEISAEGLTVNQNQQALLQVKDEEVSATNLSVSSYLNIGKNSRFADYLENRTGCFWIGEVNE